MPQHMFADTPATHSRPHDGSTPPNAPATTVEVRRDEVGATRFSLQRGRRRELLPIADVPFRRAILTSNPGECRIDGSVTALISLLLLPLANRPGGGHNQRWGMPRIALSSSSRSIDLVGPLTPRSFGPSNSVG